MSADAASPELLTRRERQVVALIAHGLQAREIAILLNRSINTVDRMRQMCYAKLNIHDRVKLARWAISNGVDVSTPVNGRLPRP